MTEKTLVLTMIREGVPIAYIAADLHVSKLTISGLKQVATGLPDKTTPTRKAGTGTKNKTTDGRGPTEGSCSMAVPAMSTRLRTSALPMPSTHPAIRNVNHR